MLLRSSSTPLLGSLLSSFSESPNNYSDPHTTVKRPPNPIHHNHNKLAFHQTASLNFTYSCNSSPTSPSIDAGGFSQNSIRRAQSEGNLEELANISRNNNEEFSISNPPKKFLSRPMCSMLQPIPSFSFHNSKGEYEGEDSDDEEEEQREQLDKNGGLFENAIRGEESIMDRNGGELNLENKNMRLNEEMRFWNEYNNVVFEKNGEKISTEMYLARGLGVDDVSIGFGGDGDGGDFISVSFTSDGGDGPGIEEHYKRMVEENPGNSLFLRNYAQFLYLSKKDLQKAEEYYSRAILADPKDGDILSQYAKLIWELHHDRDTATSYFERAAQAAPEDSHVQAAYASFLWETEEEEDDDDEDQDRAMNDPNVVPSLLDRTMVPATA